MDVGCFNAGTAVNCGRRPSLANAGWADAVILEFGFRTLVLLRQRVQVSTFLYVHTEWNVP